MAGTLYMVRHGETLFNAHHRIQGFCDSPLTEKGKQQALAVKKYFETNDISFDYAYSSTQERAIDTLELITSQPYVRCKGLKEWNFGVYEGENEYLNPPMDEQRGSYGDYFATYGGEKDVEVQERVCKTLCDIMQKEGHRQVLAVSHGGAIFMFLKAWETKKVNGKLRNGCILKFYYDDEAFFLQEIIEEHLQEDGYGKY